MVKTPVSDSESDVIQRFSFGVGCFRFSYWDGEAKQVTSEEVLNAVRKALEALPALNNLEIEPPLAPRTIEVATTARPVLQDGESIISPQAMRIDFDLYIPSRVQHSLIGETLPGGDSAVSITGTERFRVCIRDTFHGEVAFVQPLDPSGDDALDDSPSTAVQVVREFLKKNFKDPTGKVLFEVIGPSPFHADFYLTHGATKDSHRFSLKATRPLGYAAFNFTASNEHFDSPEDALEELFFDLSHELGLFYEVTCLRIQALHEWEALSTLIEGLLADTSTRSEKKTKRPKLPPLEGLMNALARFEIDQVYRDSQIAGHKRSLYDSDTDKYIRELVEEAIKEIPQYPTEQIGRVLAFHWARRQKRFEYLVATLCALLGGAVGSLITLAASK
ncbi:MAG: hypothetical protein IPK82_26640 [Polyangiaceae bacterium]|nr:hypothetical protein [Polyangiaceae bacterium]